MTNSFRTFMLMATLTVLFVIVGGALAGENGAIIAFIAAAAMNFFAYWFSDKMVLKRYRAQEVTAESNSKLYNMVSDISYQHSSKTKIIYISSAYCDIRHILAGFG